MIPPEKQKKPDIYSAYDVGWNDYRKEVKPLFDMMFACLSFTWSAILFGMILIGIGVFL